MRICHILETSGGGSGQVVLDLLEEGLAAGFAQTVVYSPVRAEQAFVEKIKNFHARIKVRALPMRRNMGMHDIAHAFQLGLLMLREGPFDVIHAHSSKAGGLARLVRFMAPGAAMIYSPHAFVTLDPNASGVYRFAEKTLARLTDAIVCVSEAERDHAIKELAIDPSKLFVVPNATKPCSHDGRVSARERMGVGAEACVVGYVGRFAPQKQPLRVLRAFEAQAGANPNLMLTMVGDGPLRAEVEAHVAEAGLGQRVKLVGEQAAQSYLPGFDVLLCGSDYEALSLVFLEALAAGVPLVTTPVGGVAECVNEGQTGFVAQAFTASALSEALGRYVSLSPEKRAGMVQATKRKSLGFTMRAQAEAMREVYSTCFCRRTNKGVAL